jgi:hypothetical protein
MFVSHDPNLGLLAHGRKERRPLLNSPAQVLLGPYDCVELAAEIRLKLLCRRDQRVGFEIADDEHVDVTPGVVVAAGIGTEYESEANALVPFEEHPKLRHDPDGARVEVTKRQVQGMAGIHPPETQGAHTSAFDQPLPRQLLKREVDRPGRPADPTYELARVKFLTRRASQER